MSAAAPGAHTTPWQEARDRPFLTVLSLWSILAGIAIITAGVFPAAAVVQIVADAPLAFTTILGALITGGGKLVLHGIVISRYDIAHIPLAWRSERAGLQLLALGWLVYGVSGAVLVPLAAVEWMTYVSLAVGFWLRSRQLRALAHRARTSPILGSTPPI